MKGRDVTRTKVFSVPPDMPTRDIVRLLLRNRDQQVQGLETRGAPFVILGTQGRLEQNDADRDEGPERECSHA